MALRRGRSRLGATALAALVVALAVLNWNLAQMRPDTSPIAPRSLPAPLPPQAGPGPAAPIQGRPEAQFREMVARPLFHPDRRPVQRERAQPKDAGGQPADMRLVGVIKAPGQPARALIRMGKEQAGRWIVEGEQLDGWRLREVSTRSVILEASGRAHELTLAGARTAPDDADASQTEQAR